MKKILLTIVLLAMVLTTGCNKKEQEINNIEENPDVQQIETNVNNSDKKTLYFYNDGFVGYLQSGEWCTPRELPLIELFSEPYTVYTYKNEKATADRVQLYLGSFGYGGFSYEGINNLDDPENYEISKYASSKENGFYTYNLPLNLDEKLAQTYTVDLPDIQLTNVKYLANGHDYAGENSTRNFVAFNGNYDLAFEEELQIEKLPEEVDTYIKNLLETNGVNPNCPYDISQYFELDLNHDGTYDQIYSVISTDLRQTRDEEQDNDSLERIDKQLKENGAFSLVLVNVNDTISVLYGSYASVEDINSTEYSMIGTTEDSTIHVVDLNNDGVYEILYTISGWEYWWDYLAVYENDSYINLIQKGLN